MNAISQVEQYYRAMIERRFDDMADYLHPDIELLTPLATIQGRGEVVTAAKNLAGLLESIEMRNKFYDGDKVMFAYDFHFVAPVGRLRAAGLFSFSGAQIHRIELFYDPRPVLELRAKIFNANSE
jgi:hypothetical protein